MLDHFTAKTLILSTNGLGINEDHLRLELLNISGKGVNIQQPSSIEGKIESTYYIGRTNTVWMKNATASETFKHVVFLLPEESGLIGSLRPRLDNFVLTFNATFLRQNKFAIAHLEELFSVKGRALVSKYLGLWRNGIGVHAEDRVLWRRRRNLGGITLKV